MRATKFVLGIVLTAGVAALAAVGCGGDSTSSGTPVDGGTDATTSKDGGSTDGAMDGTSDASDAAADTAIPFVCADAASISLSEVPACLITACGSDITACLDSCPCQDVLVTALAGGETGIATLAASSNDAAVTVYDCVVANLACAEGSGDAGTDGGGNDAANDSGSDAGNDSGSTDAGDAATDTGSTDAGDAGADADAS